MKPIDELPESEWLELVKEAVSLPGAPSAAVRATLELWRDHAPALPLTSGRVRRWIAALTFDSWAMSPAEVGVRGATGEVRHLLFAAAGRDVDLRIVPLASGFVVNGQHLGSDVRGHVQWHQVGAPASQPKQRVELTLSGEFSFEGVDSGTYMLELELGDEQIMLPPILVGARGAGL